jgi:hypothetical protein
LCDRHDVQTSSTGSGIQPSAEVYVILYDERREGQRAVVFAQQARCFLSRNYGDGMYLNLVTF